MKLNHRNIVQNHIDSSKEEIKSFQKQANMIVVNKWDNSSFYKDSNGDDNLMYYEISEVEENYSEWLKWKKKYKERSSSE